ncbi:LysR substrate-binding domain-containing protein [Sphingobium sp. EM0848]|uniref:LysR substrate-binding domain-containing protein n=1 Tax=Sphingobium sp. EM0848 TaxID=2743473 RepID=UPI00159CA631|nr:LysR substrate-binding domain-containing protein [Sphingobium sp. EM0848]
MAANYQHLRAFHAIAQDGSVTRAARRLHVSQPTLSQQLKALEERHGFALFENRKPPMQLSAAGRDLFALTERLFAVASDIDEMLGESVEMNGGTLRLASDSPLYGARMVHGFRQQHPNVTVQVRMGNAREVMRLLADGQIDAAVASDPPADAGFSYDPIFIDSLRCAMPVDHMLAGRASVPMGALCDQVLLMREPTSKTRAFTERALAAAGIAPTTLELGNRETIREGIALGLGIGLFFSAECPPDTRLTYRTLDLPAGDFKLGCYLVCQRERSRTALIRALRAIAHRMRRDGAGEAEYKAASEKQELA